MDSNQNRERAISRSRPRASLSTKRQPQKKISWWFSSIFVIAIFLIGITALYQLLTGPDSPKVLVFKITDAATGHVLSDARVISGEQIAVSDENGEARLTAPSEPVTVTIEHANYRSVYGDIDQHTNRVQPVKLVSSTVTGVIRDEETGAAIKGATVSIILADEELGISTQSETDGSFVLQNVPADAKLRIDVGDFGSQDFSIDGSEPTEFAIKLRHISGSVVDSDGQPIAGAVVAGGEKRVETDAHGAFNLPGVDIGTPLTVSASGFGEQTVEAAEAKNLTITLQPAPTTETTQRSSAARGNTSHLPTPDVVKAVYVTAQSASTPADFNRLLQLVEDTELNAMVVDLKADWVYFDTEVQFFHDAESVYPALDPAEIVKELHDRGIYAIARVVVFKDPIVAENRPDLAVQDDITGEAWRDYSDVAWVNPIKRELWQANIDLAVEIAQIGFDEIQYDYIRFPSDGDLNTADFEFDYMDEEARVGTIVEFLQASHEALQPTGAKFAVDLFGIVTIYGNDQGIGQRLADVAPFVDYVCPMIYPSHFTEGSIAVDGVPNDLPKETIELSLEIAGSIIPGMEHKLRPWLQDFSLPGMTPYGPEEVRAQIVATEQSGASGWMLWNASNYYTEGALGES